MKHGGRKAGTPNKVTAEMREILQNVLAESLADDIRALTPAERLKLLRYLSAENRCIAAEVYQSWWLDRGSSLASVKSNQEAFPLQTML